MSNHKGVVWRFLICIAGDLDIGLQVEERIDRYRNKKSVVVVNARGPAGRAGIRSGDIVRGYTLDPMTKPLKMQPWDAHSMDILNARGRHVLFGLHIRQTNKLSGIYLTRARAIMKLRLRNTRELLGKDSLGEWTVDEDAATWEQNPHA
jgi:hypothetical protein